MLAADELKAIRTRVDREAPEPVRIVRVLDFMETSWLSGPAKNLIGFARRAAQPNGSPLRVKIDVATFHRGDAPADNEFTFACRQANLELHTIQEKFAFDPKVIAAIRQLVAEHAPDIVQTHSVKSHFLVRLSGAYRGRTWIAFHHGYTWTDLKVRLYNQLDRWSLPGSSKVVTVCQPFASALEHLGIAKESIAIQHNSVNPFVASSAEAVAALRGKLEIPERARVLLNVARLSREKGQGDLIKAVALLRKHESRRELCLVLVGHGPDRQRLERLATVCGAADWVRFAGHQGDVTPFYSLADLMILPSCTEGSPNALLEAMAAGLPIVATAVGGVPEIVSARQAALLVPPQNPAALAHAIGEILDTEALRLRVSAAARETASTYSPEAYCRSMLDLYGTCLEAQRRGCESPARRSNTRRVQDNMVVTD